MSKKCICRNVSGDACGCPVHHPKKPRHLYTADQYDAKLRRCVEKVRAHGDERDVSYESAVRVAANNDALDALLRAWEENDG